MGKWRDLFESSLPPAAEREYGEEYAFGSPATADELGSVEQFLNTRLPIELRELLSEFNGVWCSTAVDRKKGYAPEIRYLDTKQMSVDVPEHLAECGNPLPASEDLQKVVFIAQDNGFADLWGICVADVAGHEAGTIVRLDHEVGELEGSYPTLADFVRRGPK